MSHRLQVVIFVELDAQLRKAAHRNRMSKGEWVRRALRESLRKSRWVVAVPDALARLGSLDAPTANIKQMLSEISGGRL